MDGDGAPHQFQSDEPLCLAHHSSALWCMVQPLVVWIPIICHRSGFKIHCQNHCFQFSSSYMSVSLWYKLSSSSFNIINCQDYHHNAPYQFQSGEPSSSSSLLCSDLWLSEYPSYVIIAASRCAVRIITRFICNVFWNKFLWRKRVLF